MENNNKKDRSHWHKKDIVRLNENFEKAHQLGKSEREIADELDVPRSTLREWKQLNNTSTLPESVINFFNTSEGFHFLHVLIIAITFVVNAISKTGLRVAELIFEITQIDKLAACSLGKLHQNTVVMDDEIIAFEEIEKANLSKGMKKKKITVAKDETEQKRKPHLIAIEPVSNFILAEQRSDKRDAKSWNEAIQEGISELNVEMIQSTSDEGSAIKKYRETHLKNAHHSPDLFHIQSDIHKATAGPLASKRRKFEKEEIKAVGNKINKVSNAIIETEKMLTKIQDGLERINSWENRISKAIATISQIYHPYDLDSGRIQTSLQINDCLENQFADIVSVAKAMGLSQKCLNRIEKSHKMVLQMTATMTFYFNTIDAMLNEKVLAPNIETLVKNKLIPIEYLKSAAEKKQVAEEKHAVRAIYKSMIEELGKDHDWNSVSPRKSHLYKSIRSKQVFVDNMR